MNLIYYSQTTPILTQQTGLAARGWITLLFHNLSGSSSKLDITVNGNVTENNQQSTLTVPSSTIDFPTNEDTILFLRNGGQQSLQIYAGPVGQAFQLIPGYNFELSGTWDLHDKAVIRTSLGSFTTYRYHNSVRGGGTTLDIYASYDQTTQVLVYGEIYANAGGISALIETVELRQANVPFNGGATSSSSVSSSPQCVIATAAYGSPLAPPVQFLKEFRDQKVEKTSLGSTFMAAFNAWYYSWAPMVAKAEATNGGLRAGVQILILPLLASLLVAEAIFNVLVAVNSNLATVAAGVVASALLGFFYFTPLVLVPVARSTKRGTFTARKMLYVIVVGAFLTLIGTIPHGSVGVVENLAALTVVETILIVPVLFTRQLTKTVMR